MSTVAAGKPAWLTKLSPAWRARMVRMGSNFHPPFVQHRWAAIHVAQDLRHIRFTCRSLGGRKYCRVALRRFVLLQSPMARMMLMAALGDSYIVWDKSASITLSKTGYSTLYADFNLRPATMKSAGRCWRPELIVLFSSN